MTLNNNGIRRVSLFIGDAEHPIDGELQLPDGTGDMMTIAKPPRFKISGKVKRTRAPLLSRYLKHAQGDREN